MKYCGNKLKEVYNGKIIDCHVCMKKCGHKGECQCNCGRKWKVKKS